FDGVRFVALDETVPLEVRRGWIRALWGARDGSLWIACDGYGLGRLGPPERSGGGVTHRRFSHFSEADGLLSNQTKCLLESSDGSLWIGSDGGLTRFKDGKFTSFTEKNGLGNNAVRAICEDAQGAIRVATMRGLSTLSKEGDISTVNF